MNSFIEADVMKFKERIIAMFSDDYFLLTAGTKENFNAMTCSWGTFGHLWNKPISCVFVRPGRYTYQYMESSELFTLSFFNQKYREKLEFLGSYSGRDFDKIARSGLTPKIICPNSISFAEAKMVFVCRKLYFQDLLKQNFVGKDIPELNYPKSDFHRMYVGSIEKLFIADQ